MWEYEVDRKVTIELLCSIPHLTDAHPFQPISLLSDELYLLHFLNDESG